MRHLITILAFTLIACGGGNQPAESPAGEANTSAPPSGDTATGGSSEPGGTPSDQAATGGGSDSKDQFTMLDTKTAKDTQGTKPSKLVSTKTEALMKFVVVDKEKGPIPGIVVSLSASDGKKYYTEETDSAGYAEALVPVGQKYEIIYVSLGRKDVTATYDVTNEPKQNIKLTLRYKRWNKPEPERVLLDGVNFDTNKATLRPESFERLDRVVEYMTVKKKARIQIAGHTDNVGKKDANKKLSENRARACRDYLISKGIDGSRVEAVGYGDERPIAPNGNEEGRQRNRRIEATDL